MDTDAPKPEYLLKCLMDHVPDMIYFKDRHSRFIMVNRAAAAWQEQPSPEAMIGLSDADVYSDDDAQRMRKDELQVMACGEPLYGIEESETWKDGSKAWVSTTKVPLRNEAGDVIGVFGISRDITVHKEAELRAARLAEENKRFRDEIEHDLLMASQLQKTFFPTFYPEFDRGTGSLPVQFCHLHEAGGVIGGDLCSIRKLSDTEVGIFLCDVMGHGVRAALGTSIVRAVVEEISHQIKDPGSFMLHMNRVLYPLFRQDDLFLFATACYMVLDVESGRLKMANAGHPMPVYLDARKGTAELLQVCGEQGCPALAVAEEAHYATTEFQLEPGDGVFMYTDGITETMDEAGAEYGEAGLLQAAGGEMNLPLSDLFQRLYTDACGFSSNGTIDDDVCLVGFRWP